MGAIQPLLEIEQAKIVLAPLAHHHLFGTLIGAVEQGAGIIINLFLQRLGVGRDPDLPLRLARPGMGWRQIAQRLADAGTGLGQQHVGLVLNKLRRENILRLDGELTLFRPAFIEASAGEIGIERLTDLFIGKRHGARLTFRRLILPLLQKGPDIERRRGNVVSRNLALIEHDLQQRRPWPALLFHQPHTRLRHQSEAKWRRF